MENSDKPMVLIAEDEAEMGLILEDIVTDLGFGVGVFMNGDEAISALEDTSRRFCALITDIKMPGVASGWDVARRARELQPSLPVIYMTGDSANHWASHGVPGSILLQKPFVDAQLVTALTTLLNEVATTAGSENPPRAT